MLFYIPFDSALQYMEHALCKQLFCIKSVYFGPTVKGNEEFRVSLLLPLYRPDGLCIGGVAGFPWAEL